MKTDWTNGRQIGQNFFLMQSCIVLKKLKDIDFVSGVHF